MKRDPMTVEYHPYKMTCEEFCEVIREDLRPFLKNMQDLKVKKQYAEEWFSMFGAWMEMHPAEEKG